MDTEQEKRELISDLMDGRLDRAGVGQAMSVLESDADARLSWQAFHVARDVMQHGGALAGSADANDFLDRLRGKLAHEVVLPAPLPVAQMVSQGTVLSGLDRGQAANQSVFRWRAVAGVASAVAVASLIWTAWDGPQRSGASGQWAQAPAAAVVASEDAQVVPVRLPGSGGAVMLRDRRLDELLAAHRQAGGDSALQTPAGFLRNATFEGADR